MLDQSDAERCDGLTGRAVAVVFARGGSKGIRNKNLRLIGGKSLLEYAIGVARESRLIGRVVVSTDDERIAAVAKQVGAEVPFMRPAGLAQDDTPEWLAWQHAVQVLQEAGALSADQAFISVPPTAPFRAVEDLNSCLTTLASKEADVVVTVRRAERNPYFNMVKVDGSGFAHLVCQPDVAVHQRQVAPEVYDLTTVAYAAWPEFILKARSMFEGRVRTVVVPVERALDIDTEYDLRVAQSLLSKDRIR